MTVCMYDWVCVCVCQSIAVLEEYLYPSLLDTETIVILAMCLILIVGSIILLAVAIRQRYVWVAIFPLSCRHVCSHLSDMWWVAIFIFISLMNLLIASNISMFIIHTNNCFYIGTGPSTMLVTSFWQTYFTVPMLRLLLWTIWSSRTSSWRW